MKGNFKVRCIEGFTCYTTKGKTYEVVDGRITYDHGAESFGRCYGIDELNEHFASQFELVSVPEITIRQKGRKVIAVMTEDGKYIKSAKAKCNPTDKFDFNIGSKLAFNRLMGEELAIKEVKRPAKVGEWIKVVNAHNTHGNYDNGSILQIVPYSWASTTPHYKNEVGCYLAPDEYVVLENYQPESKPKTLADYTNKEILSEAVKRIEG